MTDQRHEPAQRVLRPSFAALRSGPIAVTALITAISAVVVYLRIDAVSALVVLAIGLVLLLALAFTIVRARLEIRPGIVVHRRFFGSTAIAGAALDRIVWLPALESANMNYIVMSRVVAIDRGGKCVLRLSSRIWSRQTLLAVAQALGTGTQVREFGQRTTVAQVKSVEPMALSWTERNPGLSATIFIGVVALVVFPALFAIFVITGG